MEELFNIGINDEDLKDMLINYPDIKNLDDDEISQKINILRDIGCSDMNIRNIIEGNPNYLNRVSSNIILLIKKLEELGFKELNLLFEDNPYILDLDKYEIDNYIEDKINNGMTLSSIVDELEDNPYLFNDI